MCLLSVLDLFIIFPVNNLFMSLFFCLVYDSSRRSSSGTDKTPTNVLLHTEDGRSFIVFINEAKGKLFLFHGWSNVVIHLRLKKGCLVIINPVDSTTFKLSYFVDGVSRSSFWTSLASTSSHFSVIPDCILPKCYNYTSNDVNSIIYIGNKMFYVKIETVGGKVGFTNGIDVIVREFHLEAGCCSVFTKFFGIFFHLRIFGKNCVEKNFADVDVQTINIHLSDILYIKLLYNVCNKCIFIY
ncbi:putative transcription factor B3-Domain family [Helianthus annuus]|nr:putative transcription factor B3-Domain family [Helianthus annuus]